MTRKQIKRRVLYWQHLLGLSNWSIDVYFDLKRKSTSETANFITAARTESHEQYKLGSISFNPKQIRSVDDSMIVHELLHCLVSPLGGYRFKDKQNEDGFQYYSETVISELSRIILRLYKK